MEAVQQTEPIRNNIINNQPNRSQVQSTNRQARNELSGFPSTAHWELLVPNPVPVRDPENVALFRAPTIPEADADVVPIKYNYNEVFDRPPFVGVKEVPRFNLRG